MTIVWPARRRGLSRRKTEDAETGNLSRPEGIQMMVMKISPGRRYSRTHPPNKSFIPRILGLFRESEQPARDQIVQKQFAILLHLYIVLRTVGSEPGKAENRTSRVRLTKDSAPPPKPAQLATFSWPKAIHRVAKSRSAPSGSECWKGCWECVCSWA